MSVSDESCEPGGDVRCVRALVSPQCTAFYGCVCAMQCRCQLTQERAAVCGRVRVCTHACGCTCQSVCVERVVGLRVCGDPGKARTSQLAE